MAKHAKVKQATITLTRHDRLLTIVVQDESGFNLAETSTPSQPSKFGLFSIRERMKALTGQFDLQSAPGQGTTATLILPFSTTEAPVSPSRVYVPADSAAPLRKEGTRQDVCRVLIVDDHTMMREGLRSVLEGYDDIEIVGEATNGMEAIEQVVSLMPSVVVMDINMPGMNGIEATERIKKQYPNVTVVGLSVNAAKDNHDAMTRAGAAFLLTKEAAVERLYSAIKSALTAFS